MMSDLEIRKSLFSLHKGSRAYRTKSNMNCVLLDFDSCRPMVQWQATLGVVNMVNKYSIDILDKIQWNRISAPIIWLSISRKKWILMKNLFILNFCRNFIHQLTQRRVGWKMKGLVTLSRLTLTAARIKHKRLVAVYILDESIELNFHKK